MSPKSLTILALGLVSLAAAEPSFKLTAFSTSSGQPVGNVSICAANSDFNVPCITTEGFSIFQLIGSNLTYFQAGAPAVAQSMGFVDNSTLGNAEAGLFPAPKGNLAFITFPEGDDEMARTVPFGDSSRVTKRWAVCPFTFDGSSSTALSWVIGQDEPVVPTNTDCRTVQVVRTDLGY